MGYTQMYYRIAYMECILAKKKRSLWRWGNLSHAPTSQNNRGWVRLGLGGVGVRC